MSSMPVWTSPCGDISCEDFNAPRRLCVSLVNGSSHLVKPPPGRARKLYSSARAAGGAVGKQPGFWSPTENIALTACSAKSRCGPVISFQFLGGHSMEVTGRGSCTGVVLSQSRQPGLRMGQHPHFRIFSSAAEIRGILGLGGGGGGGEGEGEEEALTDGNFPRAVRPFRWGARGCCTSFPGTRGAGGKTGGCCMDMFRSGWLKVGSPGLIESEGTGAARGWATALGGDCPVRERGLLDLSLGLAVVRSGAWSSEGWGDGSGSETRRVGGLNGRPASHGTSKGGLLWLNGLVTPGAGVSWVAARNGDRGGLLWLEIGDEQLLFDKSSSCSPGFSRKSTTSEIFSTGMPSSWATCASMSSSAIEIPSSELCPGSAMSRNASMTRRIGLRFVGLKVALTRPLKPYRVDHNLATDGVPIRPNWTSNTERSLESLRSVYWGFSGMVWVADGFAGMIAATEGFSGRVGFAEEGVLKVEIVHGGSVPNLRVTRDTLVSLAYVLLQGRWCLQKLHDGAQRTHYFLGPMGHFEMISELCPVGRVEAALPTLQTICHPWKKLKFGVSI